MLPEKLSSDPAGESSSRKDHSNRADAAWRHTVDRIAAFEHRLATRSGAAGESWALDGDDASYRLFAGVVRHHALLSYFLEQSVKRAPKARLKAALMPSIFELYENVGDPGRVARIVHHAVEMIRREFSAREGGFANAVMRAIASGMPEMLVELERTARWSVLLSHPEELVKRWMGAFGADRAIDLMKWNQRVPELYANDVAGTVAEQSGDALANALEPTRWEGFYRIRRSAAAGVPELLQHRLYIQDPSTAEAPSLMGDELRGRFLDACAAPGGKLVHLWKRLAREDVESRIVAVDRDERRVRLIRQNVERLGLDRVELGCVDWGAGNCPFDNDSFDGVLVDAPCSNSGVIQRHPDVKWRLGEVDFVRMPAIQSRILDAVSSLVKPGGRLVYSTCSIDAAENEGVVDAFLGRQNLGFRLVRAVSLFPPDSGTDGVGAFLLQRE